MNESTLATMVVGLLGAGGAGGFFWWLVQRHVTRIDDLERNSATKTEVLTMNNRIDKEMERIYERELKDVRALHAQEVRDLRSDMNGMAANLRAALTETKQDINQKLDMMIEMMRRQP